jgi:U3 small nucleolar RNA-associated protein 13
LGIAAAEMLKAKPTDLSKSWTVVKRHGASYTGGPISVTHDGVTAACMCSEHVSLLNLETGIVDRIIPADTPVSVNVAGTLMRWRLYTNFAQGVTSEPIVCFAISPVAPILVTCGRASMMRVWNTQTGECIRFWKGHRLPVLVADFDPSGTLVVTGAADRNVMVWDIDHGHATHSFKEHAAPITAVKFVPHPTAVERLISASEDGVVRCWDLITQSCIAAMKEHFAAVTSIAFSTDSFGYTMLTGGRDRVVCVWDTHEFGRSSLAVAAKATIPALEGIEAIVMLLSTQSAAVSQQGTKQQDMHFVTAGDCGVLRKWHLQVIGGARYGVACKLHTNVSMLRAHKCAEEGPVTSVDTSAALANQFAHLLLRKQLGAPVPGTKRKRLGAVTTPSMYQLLATTRDNIITLVSDDDKLETLKTIVGHTDDIIDIKYIPRLAAESEQLLAVATNSEQLQVVNISSFDTRLLSGHKDIILSVSASPDGCLLATASKDNTARIWDIQSSQCLAMCEGHTEDVTSIAWPARASNFMRAAVDKAVIGNAAWLLTGSKDRTLKQWNLSHLLSCLSVPRPAGWLTEAGKRKQALPRTSAGIVAHERDINAIAVAPNDKLCATASQDKTIKLWSTVDLSHVGTLRGHKRGVWAIAFSPVDQVLVSASGDKTARLWSVNRESGFACLRTFEGHEASVLNIKFIRNGLQLMTSGADGLLKLWNVKDAECVNTFDAHTQKIWALAARTETIDAPDKSAELEIVSGGGDSLMNVWHDVTGMEAEDAVLATEEAILKQQSLYTAMATRDYFKAIQLTLELDQPGRCGDILAELLEIGPTPATSQMSAGELDNKFRQEMLQELSDLGLEEEGKPVTVAGTSSASAALEAFAHVSPALSSRRLIGEAKLIEVLSSLSPCELGRLLSYIREWNTQSKHGLLAQHVMFLVLHHVRHERLLEAFAELKAREGNFKMIAGLGSVLYALPSTAIANSSALTPIVNGVEMDAPPAAASTSAGSALKAYVDAILPYSERHADRLDRLMTSTFLVDYMLSQMNVLQPTEESLKMLGVSADGSLIRAHKMDTTQHAYNDSSSDDE